MARKRKLSHEEILQAAIAHPARASQSKLDEHREIILVLASKKIGHREIARFLHERGIRIHQTTISAYLRKHPPAEPEVARIRQKLAEQDGAKVDDAERRRKREELLARVRKERRTEPEVDDTDYAFLNVQGRPFTITPKE